MKKTVLTILFFAFVYQLQAQCTINPTVQQNYETDAKILAFREIADNPSDPDYDNPFVPVARYTPYLEKLSAIYDNPQNSPEVDSLFNEFQFRVNPVYGAASYDHIVFHKITFKVNTNVSWVQPLKDTGVAGFAPIDDFFTQYQFSLEYHFDSTLSGQTWFTFITSYDVLNIRAILPDFLAIPDIIDAIAEEEYPIFGPPYTGVQYLIEGSFIGPNEYAEVCDIRIAPNGKYEFVLAGGDCFAGCIVGESRYLTISNDCSTVTFSRTLSTEDNELTNLKIFPNPTSNFIQIEGVDALKNIEIYSLEGKKVMNAATINAQVDVSSLQTGMYFLKVIDAQNRSVMKKFLKQ